MRFDFTPPYLRHAILWMLLLLVASAHAAPVIKSPNDPREYEAFTLDNGLRVVVVSDPRTDVAAASLDVHVGSSSDPVGREGLGHFLEHMLFLGTAKYPGAGDYQQFISSHGGRHNAYTAFEDTNYFFDVEAGYLEAALDRFSQFFVAPLFTERYVQQERNAVDSEYQSKLRDDGWRVMHAWKSQANPAHPYARYFGGNVETLADREGSNIRDELIAFWKRHYSADRMALSVVGRESTAELRRWVEQHFSAIPGGGPPIEVTEQPLFVPGTLPLQVDVEPVLEQRSLTLMFPIPSVDPHSDTMPTSYIGNLIGHEGEGSLLSLFKQRGWAEGLGAGASLAHADSAVFQIGVKLTALGMDHIDDIVREVFAYVGLVRSKGVLQRIFEENRRLAEIGFEFASPSQPQSLVRYIAANLHHFPAEEVLHGPATVSRYDPELIQDFLGRLRPDNLLLVLTAPGLATDRRTQFFDSAYAVRKIDATRLAAWRPLRHDPQLAIPAANEFIPENLAVKPLEKQTEIPVRVVATPLLELWFKQDDRWRLPHADFYFSVRSPHANSDPRESVLTDLFIEVVKDSLNEYSYPAGLADLDYQLYRHSRGFSVRMSGFDDKQPVLLRRLGETLRRPQVDEKRFAAAKDELLRDLRNASKATPYSRAMDELGYLLLAPAWSDEERIAALEPITVDELRAFVDVLFGQVSVVALAHGNLRVDDAMAMADVLSHGLLADSTAVDVPRVGVVKLNADSRYSRSLEVDHDDAAVAVYFQGVDRDVAERARFNLLAQIVSAPFYSDLRTEQQLGYVVFASPFPLVEVPGVTFVVQSPAASATTLGNAVTGFLRGFAERLQSMADGDFERERAALLARVLEEDNNLSDRSRRYWQELDREQYQFDSRERMAGAVTALDRDQFTAFYRRALLGADRREIMVRAQRAPLDPAAVETRRVTDAGRFKADHERYSSIAPAAPPTRMSSTTREGGSPCVC